jgi:hypothetical protein
MFNLSFSTAILLLATACLGYSESAKELFFSDALKTVGSIVDFDFSTEKKGHLIVKPKDGAGEIIVEFEKFNNEKKCKEMYFFVSTSSSIPMTRPPFQAGNEVEWSVSSARLSLLARFGDTLLVMNGTDASPEIAKNLCEMFGRIFVSENWKNGSL